MNWPKWNWPRETGTVKIAIMAPLVTAIREPQRGGSQAFVSDLARGLTGRGHEVHVYAASGSEIPGVEVIDTGIDPESLAGTFYRAFGPAAGDAGETGTAACCLAGGRVRLHHGVYEHAGDPVRTRSTITPSTRPPSGSRRPCGHRWCTRFTCLRTRPCRRRFVRWPGAADGRRWPSYRSTSRPAPGAGSCPSTRSCRRSPAHTDHSLVAGGRAGRAVRGPAEPGEGRGGGHRHRRRGPGRRSTSTATSMMPDTAGSR